MEKLTFPLNGNLRDCDIFRTVYEDGTVLVRTQEDLAGFHLLELAIQDWKLGCKQEVWDLSGTGIFLSSMELGLPSLRIEENDAGERIYYVFEIESPTKVVRLDPKRGKNLLNNILNNSTHELMDMERFVLILNQLKEMAAVNKKRPTKQTPIIRPASEGPLKPRPNTPQPNNNTDSDDFGFIDD